MAMQAFNAGLDALVDWGTADYRWVLLSAGTFDADADTVAAALGTELTVAGYARQAVDTPVRTIDDASDQVTYTCADPVFGTLAAGEDVTAALLYRHVTDDSDSLPIAWWDLTPTATDVIDPFTLVVTDGVVTYTDRVG